jgi:hypothetical protein
MGLWWLVSPLCAGGRFRDRPSGVGGKPASEAGDGGGSIVEDFEGAVQLRHLQQHGDALLGPEQFDRTALRSGGDKAGNEFGQAGAVDVGDRGEVDDDAASLLEDLAEEQGKLGGTVGQGEAPLDGNKRYGVIATPLGGELGCASHHAG